MARRKRKRRSSPFRGHPPQGRPSKAAPGESPRENGPDCSRGIRIQRLLSAAVCALLVARPLFPSEGAAHEGDGQIVVMLWLAVAVGWALSLLGPRKVILRFGWTDAAVVTLVAAHTVAAVWGATQTAPRPAVNMLWEWVALGLGFLLVRQLLTEPRQIRAMVAVMIGLAVITAGCGLYQYFVEMPATKEAFTTDPEGMLQAADLSIEPGSAEWELFLNRLESVEPMATFALANSLAGFLAPWLVVSVGIGVLVLSDRSVSRRTLAGVAYSAVVILVCLLLTKSRGGVLAVLMGLGLWPPTRRWLTSLALAVLTGRVLRVFLGLVAGTMRSDAPRTQDAGLRKFSHQPLPPLLPGAAGAWKPTIVIGLIALLLVAAVVGLTAVGGLDIEILSEAPKSLGYRLQYWESTWGMIAEYPWLGCGPGAFQQTYTQFKLPEASEEIADPHNFLLEIWATAGPMAVAAMLAVLATFGWAVWPRRPNSTDQTGETRSDALRPEHDPDAPRFLLLGGIAGLLLAFPLGLFSGAPPTWGVYLVGLPLGALAIGLLWPWVADGRLSPGLLAAAVGALAVNLLFAGGIGYPSVAGTFWTLIALELNATDSGRRWAVSRWMAWAATAVAMALMATCWVTSYQPVMACWAELGEARVSPENALEHLLTAAENDPLSAEPWKQAAGLSFLRWQDDFQSHPHDRARWGSALEDFENYQLQALRREPRSAVSWSVFGGQLMEVYQSTAVVDCRDEAIDAYTTAVELYPTNAVYRAEFALALLAAGRHDRAEAEGREAWRLHDLTSHTDKKLKPDLRERLLRSSIGKD